jgi:NADH:ubiquinone oxidoreductase subunit K
MTSIAFFFLCLGIFTILARRTVIGLLMASHFFTLAGVTAAVLANNSIDSAEDGAVFGFFVLLGGAFQFSILVAFVIRFFYLSGMGNIESLADLKNSG